MSEMRLRYKGSSNALTVTIIHEWERDDIPTPVMSASSGPKDYLKNQIYTVFHGDLEVDRVAMVIGRGPAFVITRKGGKWFDSTRKEVEVYRVPDKSPPGGHKEKQL